MDSMARVMIVSSAAQMVSMAPEDGVPVQEQIRERSLELAAMSSPGSDLGGQIDRILGSKVFYGTVVDVAREERSTRALVKLKTRPSKFHPDGIETVRTDRTDNPAGLAMARRIQALKGHRVRVWVAMEKAGDDIEVRVLSWVEDLGEDRNVVSS